MSRTSNEDVGTVTSTIIHENAMYDKSKGVLLSHGYCGKVLFVGVVISTLVMSCLVISVRARLDIYDLTVDRANANKNIQLLAVSSLFNNAARVMQDSSNKEAALISMAGSLNREFLSESFEVALVTGVECATPPCNIHILTQPKFQSACEQTKCHTDRIAAVGSAVLASKNHEVGTLTATDYTNTEVIYSYGMIKGTAIGLILKQDKDEALSSTGTLESQTWFGGLIIYTFVVTIGFALTVLLKKVQEGMGYLPMMGLCGVAMSGFVGILVLIAYTASLEEGVKQQRRETINTASIMLASYQALRTSGMGSDAMYEGILLRWLQEFNAALPPTSEASFFLTGYESHARLLHPPRHACGVQCTTSLVTQLVNYGGATLTSHDVTLYTQKQGFLSSTYDDSVRGEQEEFKYHVAFMTERDFATKPYESVVKDMWKRGAVLVVGYCSVAFLAALLACVMLPKTSNTERTALAYPLPVVTVLSVGLCLVMMVGTGMMAMRGIGDSKEAFHKLAYGTSVSHKAGEIEMQLHKVQSSWISNLVNPTTGHASYALVTQNVDTLLQAFDDLLNDVLVLDPASSPVPVVIRSIVAETESFKKAVLVPTLSDRATAVLEGNASFLTWEATPDDAMEMARLMIKDIRQKLIDDGDSDKSSKMARLYDFENSLYTLEVLFREQVIEKDVDYFYKEYAAQSLKFTTKLKTFLEEVTAEQKKKEELGQTTTLDIAKLTQSVDNVLTNVDQHRRDFSRFNKGTLNQDQVLQSLISASVGNMQQSSEMTLLTGELTQTTKKILLKDFFATMTEQMQFVQIYSRQHTSRHVHLSSTIDEARDKAVRQAIIAAVIIVVTWLIVTCAVVLYLSTARCNTSPQGATLIPYPWVEMQDMAILLTGIMVLLVIEVIVVEQLALRQYDELRTSTEKLERIQKATKLVNAWHLGFNKFLSDSSAFVLTGDVTYMETAEKTKTYLTDLRRVGQKSIEDAQYLLGAQSTADFESATTSTTSIVESTEGTTSARQAYNTRHGSHEYETLRLLMIARSTNPAIVQFMNYINEEEKLIINTREQWLSSYSERWETVHITATLDRYNNGTPIIKWEPRAVQLTVATGYNIVFKNQLKMPDSEKDAGFFAAQLDIGLLLRNSAVQKFLTKESEWVAAFANKFRLAPQGTLSISLIVAQLGNYDLTLNQETMVTVNVNGPDQTARLDTGTAPLRGQDSPLSDLEHPSWNTGEQLEYFLPLPGGFSPELLRLEVSKPYQIGLHNQGPVCKWKEDGPGRYCSADLAIEISKDLSKEECGARVAVNPMCGNNMISNGHLCKCIAIGKTCDYQVSYDQNTVYKQDCTPPTERVDITKGIDVSALGGHVLWRRVEDASCTLDVTDLLSVGLRFSNETADTSKASFLSFMPLDEGAYTFTTVHAPLVSGSAAVSKGCFRHSAQQACYGDVMCAWSGNACSQNQLLQEMRKTTTADMPSDLWVRLQLTRSAHVMHTNHLAYIISDKSAYLTLSKEYDEYFMQNLSEIRNLGVNLRSDFLHWAHALDVERTMRQVLSNTMFVEDIFKLELDNYKPVVKTEQQYTSLSARISVRLRSFLTWSEHNTRFVFYSCCLTAWLVTIICIVILQRLAIAVRLSYDYTYRNVKA